MAAPPPLEKVSQQRRGPSNLFEAQKARRDSVKNARLLANRVALLKLEETRTLKRIADANRQAAKIQKWKKVQEERRQAKQQHIREILKHNRQMQRTFHERKQDSIKRRMLKTQDVQRQKMETVDAVRRDKLAAQKAYLKKIRSYKTRARESHNDIICMKAETRNKRISRQEQKRQKSEMAYARRMKKELLTRRRKQKDIRQLEVQEANLIQRLQNAQLMQEDALSGLQFLLASRSTA